MSIDILKTLRPAIIKVLWPLVRILLRHGVGCNEVSEVLRQVYVDVAEKEFSIKGRKQTTSRIAVLTGLNRKEVLRLRNRLEEQELEFKSENRASKVVDGWLRDKTYQDGWGKSRPLPIHGEVSFSSLVKKYSGDITLGAVLDELLRIGAVIENEDKTVSVVTTAYIPELDESQKIEMLGDASADLLNTLSHNLQHSGKESRLQLTLAYDNLPQEILQTFKSMSQQDSRMLLHKLNGWLSEHDRNVNPKVEGTGRYRAGLGIYYFEEEYKGSDHE